MVQPVTALLIQTHPSPALSSLILLSRCTLCSTPFPSPIHDSARYSTVRPFCFNTPRCSTPMSDPYTTPVTALLIQTYPSPALSSLILLFLCTLCSAPFSSPIHDSASYSTTHPDLPISSPKLFDPFVLIHLCALHPCQIHTGRQSQRCSSRPTHLQP